MLFSEYPRICFRRFHQLLMRANGGDASLAQHHDQVRPADLRQAVRDQEGGASPGSIGNCTLDLVLRSAVNGRGGIVQNQDMRIGQEGAC